MILNLNKTEVAVLLLHLTLMRKNVKKGFKKKENGEEVFNSFETVRLSLEEAIEKMEDKEIETIELHHNIKEINTLDSFLSWYIEKLERTLIESGRITKEDKGQIESLISVHQQTINLLMN